MPKTPGAKTATVEDIDRALVEIAMHQGNCKAAAEYLDAKPDTLRAWKRKSRPAHPAPR